MPDNRWYNRGSVVGPVVQFALLLAPVVVTCFFAIYALTGPLLEGRDRLNWSLEARDVAGWLLFGIVAYGLLVMALVGYRRHAMARGVGANTRRPFFRQPLVISSMVHILIAIVLSVIVFRAT